MMVVATCKTTNFLSARWVSSLSFSLPLDALMLSCECFSQKKCGHGDVDSVVVASLWPFEIGNFDEISDLLFPFFAEGSGRETK